MSERPNRFYSKRQENKVAAALGAKRQPNSGASLFAKGDVVGDDVLIECKTLTKPQKSHTIQKEWLEKNQEEAFSRGRDLSVVAFDFGDGKNYYIVREDDFVEMYNARKTLREGVP